MLDASELRDVGEVKRIVLVACLLHQARVWARDDLAEMFCKRMATIHKNGRELLAEIQERHRERSERMISVFGDVLAAAREAQTQEGDDWRLRFGIEAATVLEDAGGLEELATEHEELSAHHGNNYLPLLDRFYRGHRPLLFPAGIRARAGINERRSHPARCAGLGTGQRNPDRGVGS